MRVGLLADTHDRVPAIAELVRQMTSRGVTMVLHAGDYCAPFSLQPLIDARVALVGVFGVNDGDREGLVARASAGFGTELFDSPHTIDLGGEQILLVHDLSDVNPHSVDEHRIIVHGCTHRQEIRERGEALLVNPGEGCGWVHGTPQAAILDLDTRQVEFLALNGPEWKH